MEEIGLSGTGAEPHSLCAVSGVASVYSPRLGDLDSSEISNTEERRDAIHLYTYSECIYTFVHIYVC